MSAIVSILYEDAGHMFTDAAIYQDDGTLTDIREKVFISPHMPAAISGRCDVQVAEDFAKRLFPMFRDFDTMIMMLSSILSGQMRGLSLPWELVICGWSKSRNRPEHYICFGHDFFKETMGIEPFQIYEWQSPEFGLGSEPTPEMLKACGFESCDAASFVPERHGLAFMEAMRRTPAHINHQNPEAAHGYGIGGFCQWTKITATGVTTEIIHEWPDRVGHKINPNLTVAIAA